MIDSERRHLDKIADLGFFAAQQAFSSGCEILQRNGQLLQLEEKDMNAALSLMCGALLARLEVLVELSPDGRHTRELADTLKPQEIKLFHEKIGQHL